MPILQFQCPQGHVTERFYKTISAGAAVDEICCETCWLVAEKIFSAPLGFGLYGDPRGYDKPSPTKRFSTKTVSQKTGNSSAAG